MISLELLTEDNIDRLCSLANQSEYISELMLKENYSNFHIVWIRKEDAFVGYAIVKKVLGSFLFDHDDYENVADYISLDASYVYIPYFEVFKDAQMQGFGRKIMDDLKKHYAGEEFIVYTTADAYEFWLKQGFTEKGYSEWWYSYPT